MNAGKCSVLSTRRRDICNCVHSVAHSRTKSKAQIYGGGGDAFCRTNKKMRGKWYNSTSVWIHTHTTFSFTNANYRLIWRKCWKAKKKYVWNWHFTSYQRLELDASAVLRRVSRTPSIFCFFLALSLSIKRLKFTRIQSFLWRTFLEMEGKKQPQRRPSISSHSLVCLTRNFHFESMIFYVIMLFYVRKIYIKLMWNQQFS